MAPPATPERSIGTYSLPSLIPTNETRTPTPIDTAKMTKIRYEGEVGVTKTFIAIIKINPDPKMNIKNPNINQMATAP